MWNCISISFRRKEKGERKIPKSYIFTCSLWTSALGKQAFYLFLIRSFVTSLSYQKKEHFVFCIFSPSLFFSKWLLTDCVWGEKEWGVGWGISIHPSIHLCLLAACSDTWLQQEQAKPSLVSPPHTCLQPEPLWKNAPLTFLNNNAITFESWQPKYCWEMATIKKKLSALRERPIC